MDNQGLFSQNSVKELSQDDFELDSDAQIKVRYNSCMIVLFYNNNTESKNLLQIWNAAGKQVVGPIFGKVDLDNNKSLARAFTNLNMKNTSLHWAALKTIPFILAYQNGWPIGFYNGERTVQDIIDYSLVLACKAEYHEPVNLYGGMVASENLMMQGLTQYGTKENPFKKTSLDFTGKEDIRGYDKSDKPVLTGSPVEKAESAEVQQKERAEGAEIDIPKITPTENTIPADFAGVRVDQVKQPTERPLPPVGPATFPTTTGRTYVPSRRAPPPPPPN